MPYSPVYDHVVSWQRLPDWKDADRPTDVPDLCADARWLAAHGEHDLATGLRAAA